MSEICPIHNPLKVRVHVALDRAELGCGGDLRCAHARSPWKLEAPGSIEIEGHESKAVGLSLGENKSERDDVFGNFTPAHSSEHAYLSILLSPDQWRALMQSLMSPRPFNLVIDAVVSLDVPPADFANSFGGDVAIYRLTLHGAK